jgi:hypothetical protein
MVQDPISGVFRSGPGPSFTPDTSLPIVALQDGVANNPTSIPIIFENVGQLGAEDIEVWVSDDGGANYVFSSLFPANAQQFQEILVTLEDFDTGKLIQPLTDYKFSLRYRLSSTANRPRKRLLGISFSRSGSAATGATGTAGRQTRRSGGSRIWGAAS